MSEALPLRSRAEAATAQLGPLLARAEQLAMAVMPGGHGRRRSGAGDDFWQYRSVQAGDTMRMIDWRRSARSDAQFVRQKEWQISQTVHFWVDRAQSMQFASAKGLPQKMDRAQLVALAMAILLSRGGERIGLAGEDLPARAGTTQLRRFGEMLVTPKPDDFGAPDMRGVGKNGFAIFVSDFLGDIEPVEHAIQEAASIGIRGVCLQVLDPVEESFPFRGRAIFESVGGTLAHETLQAADLAERYKAKLETRKRRLSLVSRRCGWFFQTHHTTESAQVAVMWLYNMIEGPR